MPVPPAGIRSLPVDASTVRPELIVVVSRHAAPVKQPTGTPPKPVAGGTNALEP